MADANQLAEALRWCARALDTEHPAAIKARQVLAAHEAQAALAAEPVGEVVEMDDGCRVAVWRDGTPEPGTKLYAAPVAQAEPCHHNFVRDQEHPRHHCCQNCGAVIKEQP